MVIQLIVKYTRETWIVRKQIEHKLLILERKSSMENIWSRGVNY